MKTTENYHIWPHDLPWGDKILAVEVAIRQRGYSTSGGAYFDVTESAFRSHQAGSLHEFIELLRRYPHFQSFSSKVYFKKTAPAGSKEGITIDIDHLSSKISVSVQHDNADVVAGVLRSIADELHLSNPPLPVLEAHRALFLQPTIFVGRHFDEASDAAFRLLSEYLSLLGFLVLQGEEYASSEIPEKVRVRIDQQDIFIAMIVGRRDHAWLHAEPAYAKGKGKHIILIVQEDAGYNPTILGSDLEQIRFPSGQVERAFVPLLRELQNVRVRGL